MSRASYAASYLPKSTLNFVDSECEKAQCTFHEKCNQYDQAGRYYLEYIREHTPEIPPVFKTQFEALKKEIQALRSTPLPEEIVTAETQAAFLEHFNQHIKNLPLIERAYATVEESKKLYNEREKTVKILEQQRNSFPVKGEFFESALQKSTERQLYEFNKRKIVLDKSFTHDIGILSEKYHISPNDVAQILTNSSSFGEAANYFTNIILAFLTM